MKALASVFVKGYWRTSNDGSIRWVKEHRRQYRRVPENWIIVKSI